MAAVKRPAGINFEKILQSVKGNIQEMVQEYQESNLPITDDSKHLQQLCDRMEFILNFGLKERTVLGGRRDVWLYFCKCLAERRNILEGLKIVKANRELKTGVGRSRSFLRYCLVHQCLADVIQQCTEHKSFTAQFYSPEALLLDEKSIASLLSSLYLLCDVSFDLPPTGHDLDVSWPTFARPGTSAWRAPSRTVSMSSLSSFSSQLSEALQYQSPPAHSSMAPVGEDEPTHDCPSSPASPTSPVSPSHSSSEAGLKATLDEVSELHQRLAHLEDDNATLRASCVSLQLKLDQVQQDTPGTSEDFASEKEKSESSETEDSRNCCQESPVTCTKCEHLREELKVSQNKCTELQNLHQRLEDQIKILEKQVEDFERKESEYKCQISTLELELKAASNSEIVEVPTDVCTIEKDRESDECIRKVDVDMQQSSEACSQAESTDSVEYYRQKLEILQKMYEELQEQCRTAEKEKTTMRTNIHKIQEAEERYNQKVASLSQKEKEFETLQDDLGSLKEKFEERGNLLLIANDRVKQLEKELTACKASAKDNLDQLTLAKKQANEFRELHEQLNREYRELKEEVLSLQQQITDLHFQISSHSMERDAARKDNEEKSEALEAAQSQIAEQKASLMQLQLQTASQKEMLHNEKDQLATQVEKLNRILADRDRECSGLNKHLQEAEVALKSAKLALSETKLKLGSNEEVTNQLNEDNLSLREKIIQLLREKDALWQANVRLEGAATAASGAWMDNKSTQECMGCNVAFSLTRRRHHCRTCGRIFCTGCSDNWINTAASSRRVRVCDDCFSIHAELATIIASPAVQSSEASGNAAGLEATSRTTTQKGRPFPIGSKLPDDEEFSVISDEEVQSSRLSSSPSSGSPVSNEAITETRATTDILTPVSLAESPPTNAEAWVGAGTRVLVPVDLPAGVTLYWHFASEPKSVSFAVLHQPPQTENSQRSDSEATSSATQQRVLIPTTRVASAEGATVKGRLQTKQPGVYTLVFDNSCSRLTAKKVTYSLRLENQVSSVISRVPETASSPPPSHLEGALPAP